MVIHRYTQAEAAAVKASLYDQTTCIALSGSVACGRGVTIFFGELDVMGRVVFCRLY
jgi:hypothetical protein